MRLQKLVAILVSMAVMVGPAVASEGRAAWTASEEEDYAQREAESSHIETFAGGDGLGVVVGIVVIVALVVLIWYLLEHHHGHAMATPEETEEAMIRMMSSWSA